MSFKDNLAFGAGLIVGALGLITITGGILVISAVVHGIVLRQLWQWFMVPLGLPAVGIAHAIGIGGILKYLTYQPFLKTQKVDWKEHLVFALVYPIFMLLGGYIIHLCM